MKQIYRISAAFMAAVMIVFTFVLPASAADSTVTYRGMKKGFQFAPGSHFTTSDLFDNFKNVMPGDSLTETITVKNAAKDSDYIKVYIQAVPHDDVTNPPVVPGVTAASMQEFLAQLYMTVQSDEGLLYSASPDQLHNFEEPVYLGTILTDEIIRLDVTLQVPIELDNRFANRVGEVDWKFIVEAFDFPEPPPETPQQLTVRKVWVGEDPNQPGSVDITLMRDGVPYGSVTLTPENQWTFTWDQLSDDYTWSAVESTVSREYRAAYQTDGSVITVVNTYIPPDEPDIPDIPDEPKEPVSLTVVKVWAGDEDSIKNRPESVSVILYNGEEAVETVWLGAWNNWTFTWRDLDADGNWNVLENIPKGYTPKYSAEGTTVTITNTATLIQTGQLNWPIPVFGGIGILLIAAGFILMRKKKENTHE